MILGTKFAQETQRGNLIGFQMTHLTACQTLGVHFAKAQLHRRIAFLLRHTNLGNVTWPSFDEGYRKSNALFIEDLGHANLLAYQPFQHTRFSPLENIDETASRGNGRIISVQRSQPNVGGELVFVFAPEFALALSHIL
jgi:hypothetical protein